MARWCALKVRVDCPECGSPVWVDGPYKKAPCVACGGWVPIANSWRWMIENAFERGSGGRGFRLLTLLQAGEGVGQIYLAVNKNSPPICSACDAPLQADELPDGTTGSIHCAQCGVAHPTWPAPGFLRQARVRQVFLAPVEGEAAPQAPEAAGAKLKPVLFQCANCGAGLKLTAESTRVLTCEFCDVDQFLPAELWNRLHPVRRRRAFWLRCDG